MPVVPPPARSAAATLFHRDNGEGEGMGRTYTQIDDKLSEFITIQKVFFVATAPLSSAGHVTLSPKGLDTFRILTPLCVGYLDYVGSGVETIAHIRENGRMTLLFCAFEGPPRILRIYGRGRFVQPADEEFVRLAPRFSPQTTPRALILLDITRIADSCGFGVPLYEYKGERTQLIDSSERRGRDGLIAYQREKNAISLDGLPGLP
jgi:Pyridoxamine 5'-phosphate oxidase